MNIFVLIIIATVLMALYQYIKSRTNIFKRLGVTGPEPSFLIGNLLDVFGEDKMPPLQWREWTKTYGPIYGYYEGGRPLMVVSDPDFLQEMLVKQFNHFHGRREFPLQQNPDKGGEDIHLFIARGARWKRLRVISNPTFTAAKLKQMMPKVHCCVQEMLDILEQKCKSNAEFDIYRIYQGLTLDVIARVAFAYETSVQQGKDDGLLELCSRIFRRPPSYFIFVASVFPEIRGLLLRIARATSKLRQMPWPKLKARVEKLVEEKRQAKDANRASTDFIQLLLDAEAGENAAELDSNIASVDGSSIKSLSVKKCLTSGEIAAQCFVFLLAGYETTSTSLAYATNLLTTHQHVLDKLLDEVDEHFSDGQEITYESVQKLPYLDCVIQETLRMYPVASAAVTRRCMEPCMIKGIYIPQGVDIAADVWTLHYSEDLWGPDVEEFKPERFLPDASPKAPPHPFAYMPFGAGPKNCIGMRFALIEMKIVLCSILKRYKFAPSSNTENPLQLLFNQITVAPKNGVNILLQRRT